MIDLMVLAVGAVFLLYGVRFVQSGLGKTSVAAHLPFIFVYIAYPIGGALTVFFAFEMLLEHLGVIPPAEVARDTGRRSGLMEPMALLLLLLMLGLIFLSVPVPYAIGFSSIVVLLNTFRQTPLVLVQRTFSGLSGFTTLAIPLFILTAEIMNISGHHGQACPMLLCDRRRIRGGIAHVNVLVSMIFAGISGSSSADTGGIGRHPSSPP